MEGEFACSLIINPTQRFSLSYVRWPRRYLGGGNACKSNANIDPAWARRSGGWVLPVPIPQPLRGQEGRMEGLGAGVGDERADGSHPHGHPMLISALFPLTSHPH